MVPIATASLKHCVDNRRKRKPIVIVTMKEDVVIMNLDGHVSLS